MNLISKVLATFFLFLSLSMGQNLSTQVKNSLNSKNTLSEKKTLGHNMTTNSYLLEKGNCSVGTYALMCGVGDYINIGTSTWLFTHYNSTSFALRSGVELDNKNRIGLQFVYIDSFETGDDARYIMESYRTQAIWSYQVKDFLTVHNNLTFEYFAEETIPHSYRRNPLNNDPYQFSLSSLFEFELNEFLLLQTELGLHGLNYRYPQVLSGFSLGYKKKQFYVQGGLSMNGYHKAYFGNQANSRMFYYVNNKGETVGGEDRSNDMQLDFVIHPEIQVQYYF